MKKLISFPSAAPSLVSKDEVAHSLSTEGGRPVKVKHIHPTYESPTVRQESLLDARRTSLAALRSNRAQAQGRKERLA